MIIDQITTFYFLNNYCNLQHNNHFCFYIFLRRYLNERLSANVPPQQPFLFENDTRLEEGYNSHLSYKSAGYSPAPRPNNTTLVVRNFNTIF